MRLVMKMMAAVGLTALLLAGCSEDAQLVTEAVKNDLDTTSFEAKSVVTFDVDWPETEHHPALDLLSSGIVMDSKQKNLQEAAVSISAKNPETIKETEVWPFSEEPVMDMVVTGNDTFLTSSVDEPYLALPAVEIGEIPKEKIDELTQQLLEDFLNDYDYTLDHVIEKGTETVSLPNGDDVRAEHIQIKMDLEEAIDVTIYTIESLIELDGLDELLTLPEVAEDMEEDMPGQSELVKEGLQELVDMLKEIDQEELDSAGVEANIVLDYWIDDQTDIVQDDMAMTVHLSEEVTGESEDMTVDFDMTNQYWNRNGDVELSVPAAENIITVEQIEDHPELVEQFTEGSPLYDLAKAMQPEPDFADVSEDFWAYEEIQTLKMFDIIDGYEDNTFEPEQPITRAEFTKMVVGSLHIPTEGDLPFSDEDDIGEWAQPYVATAVNMGWIEGYEDDTFRPDELISRDEMVTVLVRALEIPTDAAVEHSFADRDQIDSWALPYVDAAAANDLVEGRPGNKFEPKGNAERAEVAALLYRALFSGDEFM